MGWYAAGCPTFGRGQTIRCCRKNSICGPYEGVKRLPGKGWVVGENIVLDHRIIGGSAALSAMSLIDSVSTKHKQQKRKSSELK